ncbi:16S rRNA (cytidine(1402)-2'-O)-methyltransferase [Hyphococcus flavus]|uniref:Ribosomal RNA small subunit methyltransferase I n=1 Tax=Hyphococcus flavus TaxID=1866326 RepID=A0AAF0CFX2_9PROT|nr:16S rRNA (cytidine(1402)-2'-O)-methyltransferase [Hyphococcus flavus]WDI32876.1 16S rRNA (cytidine(1402)-2'-O)-methyltransferase [Hyphococcus flavus]
MRNPSLRPEPGLYVTATPIGNLGDMTYRAVEIMKSADLILCEDTRQTAKLCAAYGIETRRAPYHEHNAKKVRPGILKQLNEGSVICLVSDAGTPLVSDPGYKLVREARDHGINVFPLPGASAVIAALSAAGAPSDQFYFAGFLPAKLGARTAMLNSLKSLRATLIFYETAPRLPAALSGMAELLGERTAVVAREITKLHESFAEGRLSELAEQFAATPVKGEIVIIVHPPQDSRTDEADLDAFLIDALKSMHVREAATEAAQALGVSRKEAYNRALALKGNG